jgi:hypothetical protein
MTKKDLLTADDLHQLRRSIVIAASYAMSNRDASKGRFSDTIAGVHLVRDLKRDGENWVQVSSGEPMPPAPALRAQAIRPQSLFSGPGAAIAAAPTDP